MSCHHELAVRLEGESKGSLMAATTEVGGHLPIPAGSLVSRSPGNIAGPAAATTSSSETGESTSCAAACPKAARLSTKTVHRNIAPHTHLTYVVLSRCIKSPSVKTKRATLWRR